MNGCRCWGLQYTATHCNTLYHTAAHCNTLQHTAIYCNILQRAATHCNTLLHMLGFFLENAAAVASCIHICTCIHIYEVVTSIYTSTLILHTHDSYEWLQMLGIEREMLRVSPSCSHIECHMSHLSLALYISFAENRLFYRVLLQKSLICA